MLMIEHRHGHFPFGSKLARKGVKVRWRCATHSSAVLAGTKLWEGMSESQYRNALEFSVMEVKCFVFGWGMEEGTIACAPHVEKAW